MNVSICITHLGGQTMLISTCLVWRHSKDVLLPTIHYTPTEYCSFGGSFYSADASYAWLERLPQHSLLDKVVAKKKRCMLS